MERETLHEMRLDPGVGHDLRLGDVGDPVAQTDDSRGVTHDHTVQKGVDFAVELGLCFGQGFLRCHIFGVLSFRTGSQRF